MYKNKDVPQTIKFVMDIIENMTVLKKEKLQSHESPRRGSMRTLIYNQNKLIIYQPVPKLRIQSSQIYIYKTLIE